jgi:hypothetical protein
MLYNEHCKAGKELQRKIAKLREEGKDPTLPQKPDHPPQSIATQSTSPAHPGIPRHVPSPPPHRRMTDSQNTVDESFMLLGGQRVSLDFLPCREVLEFTDSRSGVTAVRPGRCI